MARRRSSSQISYQGSVQAPAFTRPLLPASDLLAEALSYDTSLPLTEIEDRRLWNPTAPAGRSPPRSLRGSKYRLYTPKAQLAFAPQPDPLAICTRRRTRREVLFAIRKTRAGSGAKRRRRNYYSSISCKG